MNTQSILSKIADMGNEINVIFDIAGDTKHVNEINTFIADILKQGKTLNFVQLHMIVEGVNTVINIEKLKSLQTQTSADFQNSVEYAAKHYNKFATVVVTNGFKDTINLCSLHQEIVIISFKNCTTFSIPAIKKASN